MLFIFSSLFECFVHNLLVFCESGSVHNPQAHGNGLYILYQSLGNRCLVACPGTMPSACGAHSRVTLLYPAINKTYGFNEKQCHLNIGRELSTCCTAFLFFFPCKQGNRNKISTYSTCNQDLKQQQLLPYPLHPSSWLISARPGAEVMIK